LLIDTQALLWYAIDDGHLSARARQVIATPGNHYSIVTIWEAAIKSGLGKLQLWHSGSRVSAGEFFAPLTNALQLAPLPITFADAAAVEDLPPHHNDPFDRLLISQALQRNLEFVSADAIFDQYGVKRIW
jgi:PIN domain nuclease of toxin-antitoxin system